MLKINVNVSTEYTVFIENGILKSAGKLISEALGTANLKLCLVTDATVDKLYCAEDSTIMTSLKDAGFDLYKYVFPGGEKSKTIETVSAITDYLCEKHFTRNDALVAFGGGITGDITGFAASIYMRGIPFIQMPTTLLAASDSSVGGKTGVNNSYGKNLVGAFHQPEAVIFDPELLNTLSRELLLDGMAEIIKSGFIGDPSILRDALEQGAGVFEDKDSLASLVAKAVTVKRDIVREDEFEGGKRKLLNLGHTIAHGIESLSNFRISHGNAVAMGMGIVSRAAEKKGWSPHFENGVCPLTHKLLEEFEYPQNIDFTPAQLAEAALHDKKAHKDSVSIVYPYTPGDCRIKEVRNEDLEEFIASGLCI